MSNPVPAAISLLEAAGVGVAGASIGWGLFGGQLPKTPDTAIAAFNAPGMNPNPRYALNFPALQFLVRGSAGGYLSAYAKAEAIRDALLGMNETAVADGLWISVIQTGDITAAGTDETQRPILSLNFQLIIEPTATGHRAAL